MKVEIGPGPERLGDDWVTVSAFPGPQVDHLAEWGQDRIPFGDGTVSELYASHVIEHVPWMLVIPALTEAWRVLSQGGIIEIHTIDFEAVDGAYRARTSDMPDMEHFMQAINYRLYAYPKTPGDRACVNWHHGVFDFAYLSWLLEKCGFREVVRLAEPRGPEKHGAFNLGARAVKA